MFIVKKVIVHIVLICSLAILALADKLPAQDGAPVVFGDTLLHVYAAVGSFTPGDRAIAIQTRLKALSHDPDFVPESLAVAPGESSVDISYRDRIIISVTQLDAQGYGKSALETAKDYAAKISRAVEADRAQRSAGSVAREILLSLAVVAGLVAAIMAIIWLMTKLREYVAKRHVHGIRFKNYQLVAPGQVQAGYQLVLKVITLGLIVIAILVALPLLFSVFPGSRGMAAVFWSLILTPLRSIVVGIVSYLPNLITIVVIFLVVHYTIKFLRVLSDGIEKRGLRIARFHSEWARPTFEIVRFLLYVLMFIAIFPYLPGSSSAVFRGVSVFLGVLVSFGSSSAVANIIAGLVITYMRPFKVGDRVSIGEVTGDVVEKGLLVTKIRTIKNEDINLPNSNILSGHTVNYSANAKQEGLILHTTVTIGYDTPWRTVHGLLIKAAQQAPGIMAKPEPFVLQTALDDFYIRYELNASTDRPQEMATIYSALHQNIQDGFRQAKVQIMSPHYMLDPRKPKVPKR